MEQAAKKKLDISTILINLLAIGLLCYFAWMLKARGLHLRVVAIYALMMPKFISIFRAFRKTTKLTDLEQWVFIIIALVLWIIQSLITGKLHHILFS